MQYQHKGTPTFIRAHIHIQAASTTCRITHPYACGGVHTHTHTYTPAGSQVGVTHSQEHTQTYTWGRRGKQCHTVTPIHTYILIYILGKHPGR